MLYLCNRNQEDDVVSLKPIRIMTFKIFIQRLAASGRFFAAVKAEGRDVSCDFLLSQLMQRTGKSRRELESVLGAVRQLVCDELSDGNAVDVFGLVNLEPDLGLRHAISAVTVEEVRERVGRAGSGDVKFGCKARLNRELLYDLKRRFRNHLQI